MKASVIISVYKDVEALKCILVGLGRQTMQNFEVIVTEDGDDPMVKEVFLEIADPGLIHLTQEDKGFRKTRAVNRAIACARGAYLLFLDGDCVPHRTWLAEHLSCAKPGVVLAGRRMHLGPEFSSRLRRQPDYVEQLEVGHRSLNMLLALHADGARNLELIRPSPAFHSLYKRKMLNLIGCNFSGFRSDLLKVNGYNEDLPGIGGEDDDLHWRLVAAGLKVCNVKFRAIVYHLFHESRRTEVEVNMEISRRNQSLGAFYAARGVYQKEGHARFREGSLD